MVLKICLDKFICYCSSVFEIFLYGHVYGVCSISSRNKVYAPDFCVSIVNIKSIISNGFGVLDKHVLIICKIVSIFYVISCKPVIIW